MPKSFRQLREQSIHLSKKGRKTRHSRAHELEPHTAHPYTTGPSNESYESDDLMELSTFPLNLSRPRRIIRKVYRGAKGLGSRTFAKNRLTRPSSFIRRESKEQINELLGTLALGAAAGAAAGALAHRAVTKSGGVVDRIQKERKRKDQLKASIKASEERTKALKDRLRKASVVKAALNMSRESFEYCLDEELTQKRRQQLTTIKGSIKNQQLYGNHPYFGKKRQQQDRIMGKITARLNKEEAPAVSVAGGAVPSITDPTTNYAAQLKKKINMLRRKKPV